MNQHSSNATSASSSASADAISRRAYELWEKEGRPEGCEMRHWLQAEQELGQPSSSSSSSSGNGSSSAGASARNSDVNPLQGTRAGAALNASPSRENKDKARVVTSAPLNSEKNGNGGAQNAGKRKPANAPAL